MFKGLKFSNGSEKFEKIIEFLGKKQTLVVLRVFEGLKFSNEVAKFEKIRKFPGKKQT